MIEPLSKPKAALVRALHRRKGRREHAAYLAEGERTLDELARAGVEPRFVFGRESQLERLRSLFPATTVYLVDARMDAVFATDTSQGLAAIVDIPAPPSLRSIGLLAGPIIGLDGVSDPGNVGTIIRSAAWFGMSAVALLEDCADAYNPKAVRASMGAIARMPVIETSLNELLEIGRDVYGLDGEATATLRDDALPQSGVYIVGSEAHGLSSEARRHAKLVAIRGAGAIESLNAAIAASILCYELARI